MTTSSINLTTPEGGQMPVLLAEPYETPSHAIVVFHDAFGAGPYFEDVASSLASSGATAVVPHLFHRTGDPILAYDDLAQAAQQTGALDRSGLVTDIDTIIEYLSGTKGFTLDKIGALGFCMGGTISYFAATHARLGAAVTFYAGGLTSSTLGLPPLVEMAPLMKTPWLGLFGDLDHVSSPEEVEALRTALDRSASAQTELVRYPNAGHAFHCHRRDSFRSDDAADAWRRAIDWFAQNMGD